MPKLDASRFRFTREEFNRMQQEESLELIRNADPDSPYFIPIPSDRGGGLRWVTDLPSGKCQAQIRLKDFSFCQGLFVFPVDAQKAVLRAARSHFGISKISVKSA